MRRTLLWIGILAAAALGGVLIWTISGGDSQRPAAIGADTRSYSSANWGLEVGGVRMAMLKSVSCGGVSGEVVSDPVGESKLATDPKHAGPLEPEACAFEAGLLQQPGFYELVNSVLAGTAGRTALSIVALDLNYAVKGRLDFSNALITEVTFPKLDASSKESAFLTIKFKADEVKYSSGGGEKWTATAQKAASTGNFKVMVGGQDVGAAAVEAWTAKPGAAVLAGEKADRPQLGELELEVSANLGQSLEKLLDNARAGTAGETKAQLVLLNATTLATVAELNFTGVGLFAGELLNYTAPGDAVAKRRYSFYVESAELKVP